MNALERPVVVNDPVCGMRVPEGQLATTHLGIRYSFCSQQCRDRFVAHPQVYVGLPGQKAPKQEGVEVIKRRTLRLATPLPAEAASLLSGALSEMMGIKAVLVEAARIEIAYDLLQVTAEQIEARIAETGTQLGAGWGDALRTAFVHYVEECTVGSMEVVEPRFHHMSH